MFSFGDAIIIGLVILFVWHVLKRRWPKYFESEYGRALRLQNDVTEERLSSDMIATIVRRELANYVAAQPASGLDADRLAEDPPARDLRVVDEAFDSMRERPSNIGRAHVAEDGAFAGGLNRDKGG